MFGCSANNWWNREQTFIGFSDDRNTLFLAVTEPGVSKTPQQMHDVLWVLGSRYSIKQDGGGSTGMYFNDGGYGFNWNGGRAVANAWIIVPANEPPPPSTWSVDYYDTIDKWWDDNNNANKKCDASFSGSTLDRNYGGGAPCGGMDGDTWIGNYRATINFPSGNYVFRVEHDDGLKLWLNGQNIADRGSAGSTWVCPARSMSGDQNLRVMLREEGGDARVKLDWTTDTSVCAPPTPAAPDNFHVSATTPTSISLGWNDNSNNEDGFRIFRWDGSLLQFILWGTVGSNVRTFTDTSVNCGSGYSYQVAAFNGAGESSRPAYIDGFTDECLGEPDLIPYSPPGYQYPVVPSSIKATGTVNILYAGKPTYFDWNFKNIGNDVARGEFHVDLWIDDTRHIHYSQPDFGAGQPGGMDDWGIEGITPGWHTLKIVTDPDNTVAESNESNNVWEGDFLWQPVTGWWGEYFNNETLSGDPALVRDDAEIDFVWAYDSPGPGINADPFSVRWTREMSFTAGTYDFSLTHDDGIGLWIDDVLILDEWSTCCRTDQVTAYFSTGIHTLKVEMYDHFGAATAQVSWSRRQTENDDIGNAYIIDTIPYVYSQSSTDATTASDDPIIGCGTSTHSA